MGIAHFKMTTTCDTTPLFLARTRPQVKWQMQQPEPELPPMENTLLFPAVDAALCKASFPTMTVHPLNSLS